MRTRSFGVSPDTQFSLWENLLIQVDDVLKPTQVCANLVLRNLNRVDLDNSLP
jgi:hypothetical protein